MPAVGSLYPSLSARVYLLYGYLTLKDLKRGFHNLALLINIPPVRKNLF